MELPYVSMDLQSCNALSLTTYPVETVDGDGTVVLPSATVMEGDTSVETYFVNIKEHNEKGIANQTRNRKHSSITEVDSVQELVEQILTGKTATLPEYISFEKPDKNSTSHMTITAGSPVSLHVYDSVGNHTGLVYDAEGNIVGIEEQIPNSAFNKYDESSYITVDTEDVYRIEVRGEGLGTFTLELQESRGDTVVGTLVYSDILVATGAINTMTAQTIATVSSLAVDVDGDGATDVVVEKGGNSDIASLALLKKLVHLSSIQKGIKTAILAQITIAERFEKKGFAQEAIDEILFRLWGGIPAESAISLGEVVNSFHELVGSEVGK